MTKVAATPTVLDTSGTASAAPAPVAAPAVVETENQRAIEKAADFRLVIEEDPDTGSFIYKTMDRRTGEVVNQFPREQVLRLKDAANYAPGRVFNSRS
jgi:flagellar protein FlaG